MFYCAGMCAQCAPTDPVAETVRIQMPMVVGESAEPDPAYAEEKGQQGEVGAPEQEAEHQRRQEAERRHLERRLQREREQAAEQARQEREEAAERRRRQREYEEVARMSRRAHEEALRSTEAARRAEAARLAEADRAAREQERKSLVKAFLREHGYGDDVGAPKRTMLKTKYPIHTAAKAGDPKVVAALLEEGADPAQKNSDGQTAAQVAQQKDKRGSHANVLRRLGGA